MINSKVFLKGLRSLQGSKSPAIPLAACFVALGALLKDAGFNLQQSAASSLFTYALPGQLVMAESMLDGATIINIFLAVWLVNLRLYPMTVSLFPLLEPVPLLEPPTFESLRSERSTLNLLPLNS